MADVAFFYGSNETISPLACSLNGRSLPFIPHCNENPIFVFPEKELRSLSPNFHIHVSVSNLYIPRISSHIFLQQNRQTHQGNIQYKSLTDWGRSYPFLGIFVAKFWYCVFAVQTHAQIHYIFLQWWFRSMKESLSQFLFRRLQAAGSNESSEWVEVCQDNGVKWEARGGGGLAAGILHKRDRAPFRQR
jgi:hypothetical protein